MLLMVLVFFLMVSNLVEVLWFIYVKFLLEEGYVNMLIGFVIVVYFFFIVFGVFLLLCISWIFKCRYEVIFVVIFVCLVGV